MKERYSLAAEPDAMDFFRFEHIAQIHEEQMRDDKLEEVIREAAELAVKELCDMREKEGLAFGGRLLSAH